MAYTPRIRLYVDTALAPGGEVAASDAHAHYLLNVMRLRADGEVCLFNGRDGEWRAEIVLPAKKRVQFRIGAQLRPQAPEPDVLLAFAPVKRIEFLAEKATELGAAVLQPVFTRRTAASRVNTARLLANAVEAAEQSERLSVPRVEEPLPFARLIAAWPATRRLYFLDETGGGRPIAEVLKQSPEKSVGFLTGPEGGFEQAELDALRQLPFATAVGLGPRVLRAETAALAALSCWQALVGDWGGRGAN